MTVHAILDRRRAEQGELVAQALRFVQSVDAVLQVRAAVIYGSVARGDFNVWSDIDLLIVATDVPRRFPDRLALLGRPPARMEAVVWTPDEWRSQRHRRNPIATEAMARGIWLRGSAEVLELE